jgi:hypothetical protein
MKTINIAKRRSDKSPREMYLGNGKRLHFTNKREAAHFIAETNRYLTKVLVALNDTYIQVFAEYRRMWFITSNTNAGTRTNYLARENDVRKALDGADFCFQKFTTGFGSNDPCFAFIDLRKTALFLKDAADELAQFYKQRDHTGQYYSCLTLYERCIAIIAKMESYDYPSTNEKPRVETRGQLTA